MERPEILERTIKVIRAKLQLADEDVIDEGTNFLNDLHTDSLDMAEIVMEFEEEFIIKINEDDVKAVKTVGDAVTAIEKILSKA